ncbi:MAG: hypothetical protein HYV96_18250 [Opitutae bacterium]|nr:hypothetical protein [Opitutae bacterium]
MVTNTTGATAETEWVDTGEKRDALGRRHTPRERRAELLTAFRASGLTQSAFARREGINYTTFCSWAQAERQAGRLGPAGRKRRRETRASAAPMRFAEVALPSSVSGRGLEVRLADGTVVRGDSAKELAELVRALRA